MADSIEDVHAEGQYSHISTLLWYSLYAIERRGIQKREKTGPRVLDGDFAPRVAIAWSPQMKTVIRAGAGMFYDRFALGNTMTALRANGIRQQQYIITNPDFFPAIPPVASLAGFQSAQLRQQISANLQAPTYYQSVITVERQLPFNTTLAVS